MCNKRIGYWAGRRLCVEALRHSCLVRRRTAPASLRAAFNVCVYTLLHPRPSGWIVESPHA
jgi:hypothetical protein